MKIITDDGVYVQKNDIVYLNASGLLMPKCVRQKCKEELSKINIDNRYEFIQFVEGEAIIFFNNLDWIVDYNQFKDLSIDEIYKFKGTLEQSRQLLGKKLRNPELNQQYQLCVFEECCLRDMLDFRKDYININLPEGVKYPDENDNDSKKIVKSLFTNSKK